jgi:GNAT superfamily N-acetyltransferase
LTDSIDAVNLFITASKGGTLLGFISITPPEGGRYSLDRYFQRQELPFPVNDRLYEVRLLAVDQHARGQQIAGLLMYAAYRWVEARGGARIAAIGRLQILDMYRKGGLEPHGMRVQSGAVTFELLSAPVQRLRKHLMKYGPALAKLLLPSPGLQSQCRELRPRLIVCSPDAVSDSARSSRPSAGLLASVPCTQVWVLSLAWS